MEHPIRALRRERDLTLEEAARQLETSKGNLSRIETGAHGASGDLMRRIQAWSDGRISPNDMIAFSPVSSDAAA